MADIWMDVDAALAEVPVNLMPLLDDTDFKSREVSVAYNAAGMDLVWNFVTTAGAYTQTAVTPTTSGTYDWTHQGDGMYSIEIPASGGASINNDTEGFGWFTGVATGVLPWRGPVIGFRAAALNNALIDGGDTLTVTAGTVSDKSGYSLSGTQTFNVTGNITGNLSGSVGSVTGAVGSVTGNVGGNVAGSVGSVTGAVGSVTGNVGGNVAGSVASVTAGVTVTTNNDKTGYSLTSGPLDAAGVRTAIGLATANLDSQLAAIVADTNELQTDWANGGRLDLLIDGLIADLLKVKAAVYDSASVTGSVITLSNGATQTIGADGDRTTA